MQPSSRGFTASLIALHFPTKLFLFLASLFLFSPRKFYTPLLQAKVGCVLRHSITTWYSSEGLIMCCKQGNPEIMVLFSSKIYSFSVLRLSFCTLFAWGWQMGIGCNLQCWGFLNLLPEIFGKALWNISTLQWKRSTSLTKILDTNLKGLKAKGELWAKTAWSSGDIFGPPNLFSVAAKF